jgi:hypothetical protein
MLQILNIMFVAYNQLVYDVVPLQVSHVYTELLHLEKFVQFD